jgi:hypothetical protein
VHVNDAREPADSAARIGGIAILHFRAFFWCTVRDNNFAFVEVVGSGWCAIVYQAVVRGVERDVVSGGVLCGGGGVCAVGDQLQFVEDIGVVGEV